MLLMEALNSQEFLLSGEPTKRVVKHNTQAFDREVYYTVGKMIALSVIHGGPAPTFFADPVIDYLFGEKRQFKAVCGDIPDLEDREKVEKVRYSVCGSEYCHHVMNNNSCWIVKMKQC